MNDKRIVASVMIAAMFLMAFVFYPRPAEAVDTWPDTQDTICVERQSKTWGVYNATRIWNEVDAGQPQMVIRDHCFYQKSIHVWIVERPDVNWVGRSKIWNDGNGNITQVIIFLNKAKLVGYTPEEKYKIKRFISGHEFGHALGLWHTSVKGSIMCYCTNALRNNGTLNWLDRKNLRSIY